MKLWVMVYRGNGSYTDVGVTAVWEHTPTREDFERLAEEESFEEHHINDLDSKFGQCTQVGEDDMEVYYEVKEIEIR